MNKQYLIVFLVLVTILTLSACAPGPNTVAHQAATDGHIAGFWLGLWHGFISFFTFIISLFEPSVNVYEVHNNGAWYNLGFVLGAGILLGGSSGGVSRKSE